MKNRFTKLLLIVFVMLPILLFCSCDSDKDKYNDDYSTTKKTTTINVYSEDGSALNQKVDVVLETDYYCVFIVKNANYYQTSGYYTQKNGQGIKVYDDYGYYTQEFKDFCYDKKSVDVYLYKIDKTYTLTLDYGYIKYTQEHNVADNYNLPQYNKYGYIFEGWSETQNGHFAFNEVFGGKYFEDITLYPILRAKSFSIYYSTIPTNAEYCNSSILVDFGESITITQPNEIGYVFNGFYTEPNGQGDLICDEDCKLYIDFIPNDGDVFYMYAYFVEAPVQKLIYDNNELDTTMTVRYRGYYADNPDRELVVKYKQGDTIENIEPQIRNGYYFDGWYKSNTSTKYNFDNTIEKSKLVILTAKFIKADYSLFSGIVKGGNSLTLNNLAYNTPHNYTYLYDCEKDTVTFNTTFTISSSTATATLTITVAGTVAYSNNQISSGQTVSGSFSAKRGDKINISCYVNQNASGGSMYISILNSIQVISQSTVIVERPAEFMMYVTEGNNFVIEYASITGKTFVGYYTGENGTGEKITDQNGCSINKWQIKDNNYYYKPYTDYSVTEKDFGYKVYAYYI